MFGKTVNNNIRGLALPKGVEARELWEEGACVLRLSITSILTRVCPEACLKMEPSREKELRGRLGKAGSASPSMELMATGRAGRMDVQVGPSRALSPGTWLCEASFPRQRALQIVRACGGRTDQLS